MVDLWMVLIVGLFFLLMYGFIQFCNSLMEK